MIMTIKKLAPERASFFPFIAVTPNFQRIRYAGYQQDALLVQHINLQQIFNHMCYAVFVIGQGDGVCHRFDIFPGIAHRYTFSRRL